MYWSDYSELYTFVIGMKEQSADFLKNKYFYEAHLKVAYMLINRTVILEASKNHE